MKVHYTDKYLLNPTHKVTINLVGLGGTGSQVLTNLSRLHIALVGLGHPGLHVRAWDHDTVSEANIGRQLFSPADIGHNKSIVLITRVNRFFGLNWEAFPEKFNNKDRANILISCIDTAAGRIEISEKLIELNKKPREVSTKLLYWLDIGNLKKTGQVVLGTIEDIKQPTSDFKTVSTLPNVVKKFPQLKKIREVDQGPSCSLAEAINKQDLFINSTLAGFGVNMLWKLFREGMIKIQGCYVNLDTLTVNPIKI